jgi:hypothetical protein
MLTPDEAEILQQLKEGTLGKDALEFYETMLESLAAKGYIRLDHRKDTLVNATITSAGSGALQERES